MAVVKVDGKEPRQEPRLFQWVKKCPHNPDFSDFYENAYPGVFGPGEFESDVIFVFWVDPDKEIGVLMKIKVK